MNAGYLGIVLLSLAVGYVCGKAGKLAEVSFFMPSYPVLIIGLGLYRLSAAFVRGDVHSAWTAGVYPLLLVAVVVASWAHSRYHLETACQRAARRATITGGVVAWSQE